MTIAAYAIGISLGQTRNSRNFASFVSSTYIPVHLQEVASILNTQYSRLGTNLSRQSEPEAYIRMLTRTHEFSAEIAGNDMSEMQVLLEKSNAFLEHTEGKLWIVGG